jgi:hypothetical protein
MNGTVRWIAGAAVLAVASLHAPAARAELRNRCASGKETCTAKLASDLLACHVKAEAKGTTLDANCVAKAQRKFDGGPDPSRGCFAKLEARFTCFTTNDTATMGSVAGVFVTAVVTQLDPIYPTPIVNRCSSSKKKCVSDKFKRLMACYAKASNKGFALDPVCVSKAKAKFDGGLVPSKGCFAHWEAKYGAACLTTNDTAALETTVDTFADGVAGLLEPLCGNNTIESPFETCDGTSDAACPGQCAPPGASFACTCPFCGDHSVNQPGEVCDRTDDSACPDHCAFDCTCAICGNNITEPYVEDCDGTDDAACPGLCAAPASVNECHCPICGDNLVNQGSEQCDGSDDSACPGHCLDSCLCAVCGNNVAEIPVEHCDGTDDGNCPGQCAAPATPNECHCPSCGDGIMNGSEACDGTDDAACPGLCQLDCTCP